MAGADCYETCFEITGTEHRPDGLTRVSVNPQSEGNIELKGSCYEIRDNDGKEVYRFDASTVLIGGLPCYDDGCDPMTWMQRYLDHPAYGEMTDDPYSISGFAMGDILTMLVDENGHVSVLQFISYWD